jgi:hypothetical protein
MSCRDERSRHVRRLPHEFWVCSLVFLVGVAKRWVDEEVRLIFFVMWLSLLWIRGLGIT